MIVLLAIIIVLLFIRPREIIYVVSVTLRTKIGSRWGITFFCNLFIVKLYIKVTEDKQLRFKS